MDEVDLRRVDAENLVGDLGEGRLEALAVGMQADAELESAVRRDAGGRLLVSRHHGDAPPRVDRRAVCRLLAIDRKADADAPAVGLATFLALANGREVDRRDRAAQGFRIIAAVEVLLRDVVEWHLLGPHEIFQPYLGRLEAGFPCDGIEHELEREADARARDAAVGQDWAFVGGDRIRSTTIGREIVRAGQNARDLRRFEAGREGIGGIGP